MSPIPHHPPIMRMRFTPHQMSVPFVQAAQERMSTPRRLPMPTCFPLPHISPFPHEQSKRAALQKPPCSKARIVGRTCSPCSAFHFPRRPPFIHTIFLKSPFHRIPMSQRADAPYPQKQRAEECSRTPSPTPLLPIKTCNIQKTPVPHFRDERSCVSKKQPCRPSGAPAPKKIASPARRVSPAPRGCTRGSPSATPRDCSAPSCTFRRA